MEYILLTVGGVAMIFKDRSNKPVRRRFLCAPNLQQGSRIVSCDGQISFVLAAIRPRESPVFTAEWVLK